MFKELEGKKVKVFLNCSQFNEYSVAGVVTNSDESWVFLEGKKTNEIVAISEIKRISVEMK